MKAFRFPGRLFCLHKPIVSLRGFLVEQRVENKEVVVYGADMFGNRSGGG